MPSRLDSTLALARFHASSGTRAALRAHVPLLAAALVAVGLSPSPGATLLAAARAFGSAPGDAAAPWIATVLALGLAGTAAPRVLAGRAGWARTLSASGTDHRRGVALGLALTLAPLVVIGALLVTGAALAGLSPSLPRLLGLPLLALGAAQFTLPVQREIATRTVALVACCLAPHGTWAATAGALVAVVIADLVAGPLLMAPPRVRARGGAGAATNLRLSLRATGLAVLGPLVAAMLPLAGGLLFVVNNDLGVAKEAAAARLGAGLAVVAVTQWLAGLMARMRPTWAWSRSLPWSSSRRVVEDALLVGVPAVPFALAAAWFSPMVALAVLACVPWMALRAAALMRVDEERREAAEGFAAAETFLTACAVALVPWVALALLAGVPLALRLAVMREQRRKVTRRHELDPEEVT